MLSVSIFENQVFLRSKRKHKMYYIQFIKMGYIFMMGKKETLEK